VPTWEGTLANTIELVLPSAYPSPQPKRQIDRFSCFWTASGKTSLYFTMGDPFPQKLPLLVGGSGPPSKSWFLKPDRAHSPNSISIVSAVFSQVTAECPYTLQWDAPFPSKLPLPMGESGPPCNTWFPGPTQVLNPNGISIGSAVLAGLTSVTDRPTDRQTTLLGR